MSSEDANSVVLMLSDGHECRSQSPAQCLTAWSCAQYKKHITENSETPQKGIAQALQTGNIQKWISKAADE